MTFHVTCSSAPFPHSSPFQRRFSFHVFSEAKISKLIIGQCVNLNCSSKFERKLQKSEHLRYFAFELFICGVSLWPDAYQSWISRRTWLCCQFGECMPVGVVVYYRVPASILNEQFTCVVDSCDDWLVDLLAAFINIAVTHLVGRLNICYLFGGFIACRFNKQLWKYKQGYGRRSTNLSTSFAKESPWETCSTNGHHSFVLFGCLHYCWHFCNGYNKKFDNRTSLWSALMDWAFGESSVG